MFEHIDAYPGDPILTLNENFQKDPRDQKVNLSIGIYFDAEGRIPVMGAVREAETALQRDSGAKPYLPMVGRVSRRRAGARVRRRSPGPRGRPHRDAADARRLRRTEGGRRFPEALLPGIAGVAQRSELGKPSLHLRARRLHGEHVSVLRRGDGRPEVRRDARGDRRAAGAQHRAAARVLPQPDRCRPRRRPVGEADRRDRGARAAAVRRHGVPGLRRGSRRGRVRGARAGPPRRAGAGRELVLEELRCTASAWAA